MIRKSPLRWLLFLPALTLFASCSSTDGIDDYFTFNIERSSAFIVDSQTQVGQDNSYVTSFVLDSVDFAKNGTSLSLIKSVKLTKVSFVSDKSNLLSNLDSIWIGITADSLAEIPVAGYNVANDSVLYNSIDFGQYIKSPSVKWNVHFRANKAPSDFQGVAFTYTLVFTAKPQE
jgi:hypothetical protein